MPVFSRVQDDVLIVTVDGDFTPGELARKGGEALGDISLPPEVGVLLDVSGAVGIQAEVAEMARVFMEHPTEVPRIAVLGAQESTKVDGVEIRGFITRAEAMEWLKV